MSVGRVSRVQSVLDISMEGEYLRAMSRSPYSLATGELRDADFEDFVEIFSCIFLGTPALGREWSETEPVRRG